jgi:hypothetical protein
MKLPLFAETPTTANTNVTWLFEHRAFRPFAGIAGQGHQERAEEIVRACNSHAGLVQALKDCLELMRLDGYNDLTSQTARDAIAALAAAGEQP